MKTLGKMTDHFETVLRCDGPLKLYARNLREAGYIRSGARGVNAPEMTPIDAAALLTAILVTDRPNFAVDAVKDFSGIPLLAIHQATDDDVERYDLFDFFEIEEGMTLRAVLGQIIHGYSDLDVLKRLEHGFEIDLGNGAKQRFPLSVRIECVAREGYVEILFGGWAYIYQPCSENESVNFANMEYFRDVYGRGLRTTRELTIPDLLLIGTFFRSDEDKVEPAEATEIAQ